MPIEKGQIVDNLIPTEPVVITKIQPLGAMVSLTYTGVNSTRSSSKVISAEEFSNLNPVATEGSFNFSGDPEKFSLFAEAERINSAYQFDPLFAVNCSIVDPLPHQVEAVYKFLLPLPKIRFLLADDTGAGKTIMTGLLIKELLMRGFIERILIITPGGLTKQWQEDEMGIKFNIPFKLVNRSIFNADPNIFHNSNKIVASIDFISREDVINVLNNTHWDLIVFDESHKLSAYEYAGKQYLSQRYKAAKALSHQCEHLLLLTATPHRGRADTFKKLLQLLDEDIFATEETSQERINQFEHNGLNKFFIRRLKEDMKDWAGNPLYKQRYTRTVAYKITDAEKQLYDAVTNYLSKRKKEATDTNNIYVSLALTVMQRRLASSIFAIKNTLEKRWKALQGIVDEVAQNPNLWNQRHKLEGFDIDNIDDFDELGDDEREGLENILSDPRKFKLFTTAKSIQEIREEAQEVRRLFEMADNLFKQSQEEQKFKELQSLLKSNGIYDNEKLVIFTEHKDTLNYLEERLSKNGGFKVATIHGGKNVDERRTAQREFAKHETQILICTDAAGEGVNLQFARLLINWDIPWNPNRLEQRMGRIHRYGQKQDCIVFNMVADNTKEGYVLAKLLSKLDIIRNSIGDDRVYDVIQDVLQDVKLDDLAKSILNGQVTEFNNFIEQDDATLESEFKEKISSQKDRLAHSSIDYIDARRLKENSDEKRLQPIYIRLFFEKAFKYLGGKFTEIRPNIFRLDEIPTLVNHTLQKEYNIHFDKFKSILFCFEKQIFLEYQNINDLGSVYYINPGNAIFDSLVATIIDLYRQEMLKGTVLVSPDENFDYFAFFVKSQITDNRPSKRDDSIADERLLMVYKDASGNFKATSPAKFLDLHPPVEFAKPITPPAPISNEEVVEWSFINITLPQFNETKEHVTLDASKRQEYLETAFTQVIFDLQGQINELQAKLLLGDTKVEDKYQRLFEQVEILKKKRDARIQNLLLMQEVSPKSPEVMGCAYVVPLSQVEYLGHYGMSRDDEAEQIAMQVAMDFETSQGWSPFDVSANNEGYDIRSISPESIKRYIEVKGRSGDDGSVMISENEYNRLAQLGDTAWLYIVISCKSTPKLHRIQNPVKHLKFEVKSKGIQYFLAMSAWSSHTEKIIV